MEDVVAVRDRLACPAAARAGAGLLFEETGMYPNSALTAAQLAIIAVVPLLCLAIWLVSVYVAAREPRHHQSNAGTASLPHQPQDAEKTQRKAALWD